MPGKIADSLARSANSSTAVEAEFKEAREQEFWQWTKRPDISHKLGIEKEDAKTWRNAIRKLIPEAAWVLPPEDPDPPDESAHPASLI